MTLKGRGKIAFIILIFITFLLLAYSKFFKEKEEALQIEPKTEEGEVYSSNIIKNVKYTTKDAEGNEYTITASEAEIDYTNSNILYLTNVSALIKLVNLESISINSEYGKYNSENFDTIFSKNVIINYLDNNITGEYLDFSLDRNLMLISRKVVYTSLENILRADAIEINIKTKDAKIFMYENQKKVNIKSIN
tara:strand:+ start:3001 stop:3579 length:579 start_codon:yes stop_codon:yes gene_type:complete